MEKKFVSLQHIYNSTCIGIEPTQEGYQQFHKKFTQMLKLFGIDIEVLKKGENKGYRIPNTQTENVKKIVDAEADSIMKKLKNGNKGKVIGNKDLKKVSINGVEELLVILLDFLEDSLSEEDATIQINKIEDNIRFMLEKEERRVCTNLKREITNDMIDIKIYDSELELCEGDRILLIEYYESLLLDAIKSWREITKIFSEIRKEELFDIDIEGGDKAIIECAEETNEILNKYYISEINHDRLQDDDKKRLEYLQRKEKQLCAERFSKMKDSVEVLMEAVREYRSNLEIPIQKAGERERLNEMVKEILREYEAD